MSASDDTVVLIPSRMASTRLPGKPLADICGTPMIVHVVRRGEAADVGPVVVAASEPEVAEAPEPEAPAAAEPAVESQWFKVTYVAPAKKPVRVPSSGRVKSVDVANGDVVTPRQVFEILRQTGAAGVMIGRGALGNPWIFEQTLSLARGGPIRNPSMEERLATLERHAEMLRTTFPDPRALASNLKKYVAA